MQSRCKPLSCLLVPAPAMSALDLALARPPPPTLDEHLPSLPPLVLAPMVRLGTLPLRLLALQRGAALVYTEELTDHKLASARRVADARLGTTDWLGADGRKILQTCPAERGRLVVQLGTGEPRGAVAACANLFDVGDPMRDGIVAVDVNMGCPIDKVCSFGGGAGMLDRPTKLESVLRSVKAALKDTPLTVKMRTGKDDESLKAHDILPRLIEFGVVAATLHGRTRRARYTKSADWAYIKRCADAAAPSGLSVIGNGDVYNWQDVESAYEAGVAGVMVARGAIIKPWIFTEIKEKRHWDISAGERLELLQARAEEWRPRRWVLRREVGRGGSGFVAGRKRPWGAQRGGAPHPPGLWLRASAACVWSILLGAFPNSWAPWLRAALYPKSLRT